MLLFIYFFQDADQYKYGKNRVEADAKRLQAKEEELLRRREGLRDRLAQLRKERKGLRAAIEVNAGRRGCWPGWSPPALASRPCLLRRGSEPHRLPLRPRRPKRCFLQFAGLAGKCRAGATMSKSQ